MTVSLFDSMTPLLASAIGAAIPLLLAALGELIAERAGVLNLGLEGMMLMGALISFMTVTQGGPLWLAVVLGMAAGTLCALLFGVVTLSFMANQVTTGLSMTILGAGMSAVLGKGYSGIAAADSFNPMPIPLLCDLPILGPSLFSLNFLGYLSIALLIGVSWFLNQSNAGLSLKAVGESPVVAHSLGLHVTRIRYLAVLFGGCMSGLAGSYYSVAQFKMWQDNLTSGNGWIALALVVFATWRPSRAALGALLFGGVSALGLYFQAIDVHVSTFALASLPYIATVLVLVVLSSNQENIKRHAPAWLGKTYYDES